MAEYSVVKIGMGLLQSTGAEDLERECNKMAKEGWRLVSTAGFIRGAELYMFFERQS